jgi:hypothetical protein
MTHITSAELIEIVPDLRALAKVEASAEVRDALIRLADRYAAMAGETWGHDPATMACAFMAQVP